MQKTYPKHMHVNESTLAYKVCMNLANYVVSDAAGHIFRYHQRYWLIPPKAQVAQRLGPAVPELSFLFSVQVKAMPAEQLLAGETGEFCVRRR